MKLSAQRLTGLYFAVVLILMMVLGACSLKANPSTPAAEQSTNTVSPNDDPGTVISFTQVPPPDDAR